MSESTRVALGNNPYEPPATRSSTPARNELAEAARGFTRGRLFLRSSSVVMLLFALNYGGGIFFVTAPRPVAGSLAGTYAAMVLVFALGLYEAVMLWRFSSSLYELHAVPTYANVAATLRTLRYFWMAIVIAVLGSSISTGYFRALGLASAITVLTYDDASGCREESRALRFVILVAAAVHVIQGVTPLLTAKHHSTVERTLQGLPQGGTWTPILTLLVGVIAAWMAWRITPRLRAFELAPSAATLTGVATAYRAWFIFVVLSFVVGMAYVLLLLVGPKLMPADVLARLLHP